jgi:hypothetical protein
MDILRQEQAMVVLYTPSCFNPLRGTMNYESLDVGAVESIV